MKTGQEILSSNLLFCFHYNLFNSESYYSSTWQVEMYSFYILDYQRGDNPYSQQ